MLNLESLRKNVADDCTSLERKLEAILQRAAVVPVVPAAAAAAAPAAVPAVPVFSSQNSTHEKSLLLGILALLVTLVLFWIMATLDTMHENLDPTYWAIIHACVCILVVSTIFAAEQCSASQRRRTKGHTFTMSITPNLALNMFALEEKVLQYNRILEDKLELPRGSSNAVKTRRGVRHIRWREPAINVGGTRSWRGVELDAQIVVRYHGSGATLLSLTLNLPSKVGVLPFRWMHEMLLLKWIQRLEKSRQSRQWT